MSDLPLHDQAFARIRMSVCAFHPAYVDPDRHALNVWRVVQEATNGNARGRPGWRLVADQGRDDPEEGDST